MVLLRSVLLILGLVVFGSTAPIDVPLTVEETAGVDRQQWPVTAGVPLPKGAVKNTEKLQILDPQGRFVPARFAVATRWWDDGSLQWIHCDFAVTLKAHGKATYFLREIMPLPDFPSPIGFIPRGREFEVITGPLRLVLGGNSNQLLDQVWVDENWGYDFTEKTKILDSGNFDLVLTSSGRDFRASHWTQNRYEVEEYSPLRAVVKISGSFALAGQKEKRLDYQARLTVYGGKTYFKLEFTLLNRAASGQAPGVIKVDDLSLSVKMNLDLTQQRFAFGGDTMDHQGSFEGAPQAVLFQQSSDHYVVTGAGEGSGTGKSRKSLNVGWADLSDQQLGLSVGIRWFWQLYPKAFEARSDGTLVVKLFPSQAPGQEFPAATARTHEMLFHFHGKRHYESGQVKRTLIGFQKPLYAVAPPRWYCRDTRVFGRLLENSSDLLKPELASRVSQIDSWVQKNRDALLASRDESRRVGKSELDGYGVFQFANLFALPATQPAPHLPGDLPHALYLHFFRTGDLKSLEFAGESLAQAADLGLMAESASAAESAAAATIEGLFDSFLFTGNRQHLEAARALASRLSRPNAPDQVESMAGAAAAVRALLRSYEVTGDQRWLNSSLSWMALLAAWQDGDTSKLAKLAPRLASRWKESFRESLGETAAECGIVWNVLRHYLEARGDKTLVSRMERCWEWILRNPAEWNADQKWLAGSPLSGMVLAQGLAALSQATGENKYWNAANELLQASVGPEPVLDSPGLMGACFTAAQEVIGYFSKDSQPESKRDVSVLVKP